MSVCTASSMATAAVMTSDHTQALCCLQYIHFMSRAFFWFYEGCWLGDCGSEKFPKDICGCYFLGIVGVCGCCFWILRKEISLLVIFHNYPGCCRCRLLGWSSGLLNGKSLEPQKNVAQENVVLRRCQPGPLIFFIFVSIVSNTRKSIRISEFRSTSKRHQILGNSPKFRQTHVSTIISVTFRWVCFGNSPPYFLKTVVWWNQDWFFFSASTVSALVLGLFGNSHYIYGYPVKLLLSKHIWYCRVCVSVDFCTMRFICGKVVTKWASPALRWTYNQYVCEYYTLYWYIAKVGGGSSKWKSHSKSNFHENGQIWYHFLAFCFKVSKSFLYKGSIGAILDRGYSVYISFPTGSQNHSNVGLDLPKWRPV